MDVKVIESRRDTGTSRFCSTKISENMVSNPKNKLNLFRNTDERNAG